MRKSIGEGRIETNSLKQLVDPGPTLVLISYSVDDERFADDGFDRHPRIQRRVGILKDDLHTCSHATQLIFAERSQILPLEVDDAFGRLVQLKDRTSQR